LSRWALSNQRRTARSSVRSACWSHAASALYDSLGWRHLASGQAFAQSPFIHSERQIVAVIPSADSGLLTVESIEPPAEDNPQPPSSVQLNFYRIRLPSAAGQGVVVAYAGGALARGVVDLPLSSAGMINVLDQGKQQWAFDFRSHTGKVNPLNKTGGATAAGEQCDDGNTINGDGCDNNCTVPACGNHIVDPGEQCDDGKDGNGNGCDDNCTTTACGNGVQTAGEACDDGNLMNNDGCSSGCVVEFCGDGIKNNGEACDTAGNSQGCNADCTAPARGDGKINQAFKPLGATHGEQCDDHNVLNNDGCSSTCQFEFCGDGIKNNGEACDDGGNSPLCNADCTLPACGDGKTNPQFKPDGVHVDAVAMRRPIE